jgi:hypothetical protein
MTPENIKNKRLFSLFLLGLLLFNYPILSLFNLEIFIFDIPLLYIFLFSVWGFIIISMIFITKTHPATSFQKKKRSIYRKSRPGFPSFKDR